MNTKQKTKIIGDFGLRQTLLDNCKLSIILLLAAIISGCAKDPVDNPDNPETPVNVVMQNVALTGLVKDASGNPLSGVKVTTGSLNATTDGDGKFSFTKAGTVDSTVVVKFEKSGYFTLTRSGDKQDEMYIEAMLYPKGNDSISLQTDFDAAKATSLQLGGVKIDLPANCMAKADGTAYSGTVRADVLYLNPANENTASLMHGGDLTCICSDKSKEMVIPIGMMDVVFTDNSGNPLEIKNNTNVPVSFPVPSGATAASVPHWTFNEAKGIWVEDGSLTLQGNVYTGTVSHFTGHAAGTPYESVTIQVQAIKCDDKPVAGAKVNIVDAGWGDNLVSGITNSAGYCSMKIPVSTKWNTYLVVQATYKGEQQQSSYFLADIYYGKQSVVVKFSGDCGDLPESASLKYNFMSVPGAGYIEIVTFANYFQRVRVDWFGLGGIQHSIQILDPFNNFYEEYIGVGWVKFPAVDVSTISGDIINDHPEEKFLANGYTQLQNEIIGGQSCEVFQDNNTGDKEYIWRNLGVGSRSADGKFVGVDSITVKVPADAFTEKVDPYWIYKNNN